MFGTDSHATMTNIGVLGWGVGGEAEAAAR